MIAQSVVKTRVKVPVSLWVLSVASARLDFVVSERSLSPVSLDFSSE